MQAASWRLSLQQVGQLGDIHSNTPGFVHRQHMGNVGVRPRLPP
jgi:hypothetical protein